MENIESVRQRYPMKGPVIAIDGGAGTGKSSVTKRLADELGFVQVDTGALYRSVAWVCAKNGVSSQFTEKEEPKIRSIVESIQIEFKRDPSKNPKNRVWVNGQDVTEVIRTAENSMAASKVSSMGFVREALFEFQRKIGAQGRTILEGRDIGTVIFPDAEIKFFLTASVNERTKRRLIELEATGMDPPSFEELKNQIIARDEADQKREIAPLKKAKDATLLDTTPYTLDEVVEILKTEVRKKIKV